MTNSKFVRAGSSIVVTLALLLCVAAVCLENGAWVRAERLHRPLHPEVQSSSTYIVPVGIAGWLGAIFYAVGDDAGISDLRLWVDGDEWGPAHAAHTELRRGNTRAFSHWNGNVHFWLPPGVVNDRLDLRAEYSVRLRPIILQALSFVTPGLLLLHLALFCAGRRETGSVITPRWAPPLLLFFPAVSWAAIAGSAVYFGTILYGIVAGYALPTAAVFDLIPGAGQLVTIEPYVPMAILAFAALGTTASWLANLAVLPRFAVRRAEAAQLRLWSRWGLLFVVALAVFSVSSAGWSGQTRPADLNYMSLAGLVPNSDAANYFTAISDQLQFGTWNDLGSRRPLAEAFRQLTAFAVRYSYVGMLLLQTVLVAMMLFAAAASVASWRGIWTSIAFVGLIIMLARPYLSTLMAEPLGMLWGLFCALFFVEALKRQSFSHALVALLALTIGLWTRMGAMFAVPFLALWLVLAFGKSRNGRLRLLFAAIGVVAVVVAMNSLLAALYGAPGTVTGANFAYTFCGLVHGSDWGSCATRYAAALQALDERSQAMVLLQKAWEHFLQHPQDLFGKLLSNSYEFLLGLPRFFLSGGATPDRSTGVYVLLATWFLVPGLVHTLRSRSSAAERSFWLLLWAGIALSAAIVFADAGWRNLQVTNALLAIFVALGFVTPGSVVTSAADRWIVRPRNGVIVITALLALFVTIPALARAVDRVDPTPPPEAGPRPPSTKLVAGGRWLTGFLVLADGHTRPISTPSLNYSEFSKMVRLSGLEGETGPFLDEAAARVPFAFMTAPEIDGRNSTALYIAPPDVLLRPHAKVWRLNVTGSRPGNIIRFVELAEPLGSR